MLHEEPRVLVPVTVVNFNYKSVLVVVNSLVLHVVGGCVPLTRVNVGSARVLIKWVVKPTNRLVWVINGISCLNSLHTTRTNCLFKRCNVKFCVFGNLVI